MKSVALHNLGCKVNAYEIEVMQQKLEENGFKIVPFASGADIYIINTCTVTNIADRKSRQMLHKAKKMNPQALVVATGCYVQTGEETLKMDECIDLAVGNNRKKDIVPILEEYLATHKNEKITPVFDINHTYEYEEMTLKKTADHTRAYIKIQDGCNQFCSYCIIPYARGRVRSRKKENIIHEIEGLVAAGFQEVVITGIHLSSYGMDFIEKTNSNDTDASDYLEGAKDLRSAAYQTEFLLNLLKDIHNIDGLSRIRLGSLEPRIITEHFAQELGKMKKICPHFHLSLQSGCDATLKRMNRHYSIEEYHSKVLILRKYFTNPAITTDIITGFPGETEDEFMQTAAFAEKVKFYEMHIFKYSKRQGTVAASMENQIEEEIKAKRSDILLEMTTKHSKEFRENLLGTETEILMEEQKNIDGIEYWLGHTMNYVLVACISRENLSNKLITGVPRAFLRDDILLM